MKFGKKFEGESVPGWSLHNLDYNSLKHQIKAHTSKDQATAMAIPGQPDPALEKFEGNFYAELAMQHDRIDLFVSSKADEISRRLRHIAALVYRLIARCSDDRGVDLKRQRKFGKFQEQILDCGDEIKALERFVNAQAIGFRKILKKYRKWTGSRSLETRFKENILSDPKSFTKRDFTALHQQQRDLLDALHTAAPDTSGASSPVERRNSRLMEQRSRRQSQASLLQTTAQTDFQPAPAPARQTVHYWNEYDDGSERGEDDTYAIYIDPSESPSFPVFTYLQNVLSKPVTKARMWFKRSSSWSSSGVTAVETSPLLQNAIANVHYDSTQQTDATDATEDEYASSEDQFPLGYEAHYASLPSIESQKLTLYREKVLHRTTIVSLVAAIVLLLVASVLLVTGRHKQRLEVDAGVAIGVVASLFCGCIGLGGMIYREGQVSPLYVFIVWVAFCVVCVLDGLLLVLVVDSAKL